MHVLQPKISKLKDEEVKKLLEKYNISLSQLPRISQEDKQLPEGSQVGDVFKIERKISEEGETIEYFRAVV